MRNQKNNFMNKLRTEIVHMVFQTLLENTSKKSMRITKRLLNFHS
jgi:hypothetical protein